MYVTHLRMGKGTHRGMHMRDDARFGTRIRIYVGPLYDVFQKWRPGFTGADVNTSFDCAVPDPRVYFGSPDNEGNGKISRLATKAQKPMAHAKD